MALLLFQGIKKVPEPSFSTTNTLLSQLASPLWLTVKCSGLIPNSTESPSEAEAENFWNTNFSRSHYINLSLITTFAYNFSGDKIHFW